MGDILATMARGLLTWDPRPMLILTSSMVDIMDLAMPTMDFTILPMVVILTMERDLPMLKPRLIPMCMVDPMDSVIPWLWWIWIWTSCLLWISRESHHIESDSTTIFVFSICDQNFSAWRYILVTESRKH